MRKTFGRVLGVALASVLALGGMAGCDNSPKSTEELLERYEALENRGNYTFEHEFDIAVAGNAVVDYATKGDVTPEASHMTTTGLFLGHDTTNERYVELVDNAYVQYRSIEIKGITLWARSVVDGISPLSSLTTHDLLEKGAFAATEDGYTLTVPGSDFVPAYIGMGEDTYPDLAEDVQGSDTASLLEACRASEAVYTFNKDFELTGITCDVAVSDDGATNEAGESTATGDAAYTIALAYSIGNYGTVEADAVTVPQSVKDSAIDIKEALAKAKELAGEAIDKVGSVVSDLTDRAREGLDELGTYLENVDVSGLIDQVTDAVSNAA